MAWDVYRGVTENLNQRFKATLNVFHKDKNDDTNHVLAAHNGFWVLFDTEHKAAFMERSPTGKPTSTAQKSCIIWEDSHGGIKEANVLDCWAIGLSDKPTLCVSECTCRKHRVIWYHCGSNALNMTYNLTRGGEKETCFFHCDFGVWSMWVPSYMSVQPESLKPALLVVFTKASIAVTIAHV